MAGPEAAGMRGALGTLLALLIATGGAGAQSSWTHLLHDQWAWGSSFQVQVPEHWKAEPSGDDLLLSLGSCQVKLTVSGDPARLERELLGQKPGLKLHGPGSLEIAQGHFELRQGSDEGGWEATVASLKTPSGQSLVLSTLMTAQDRSSCLSGLESLLNSAQFR